MDRKLHIKSPLRLSVPLSKLSGRTIYLKLDNTQSLIAASLAQGHGTGTYLQTDTPADSSVAAANFGGSAAPAL